jgi:hypothetical protein
MGCGDLEPPGSLFHPPHARRRKKGEQEEAKEGEEF